MVQGIEVFKAFFKGYEKEYVLIGGFAYVYWMSQAGLSARKTKDLDIVVLSLRSHQHFIKRLLEFVELGEYKARSKAYGKVQNYRFTHPKEGFPKQLEVMMGRNNSIPEDQVSLHHVTEEQTEISAILLDEPYYQLIEQEHLIFDGISVVDIDVLILLKIKAWLNFIHDKKEGIEVKTFDLNKHREDVLSLLETISGQSKVTINHTIRNDIIDFINELKLYNRTVKKYDADQVNNYITSLKTYFKVFDIF